jgi:hypothetical protein
MGDRAPRAHCDPHVIATFYYNGHNFRIVAYDGSRTYATGDNDKPSHPWYALSVDMQEENALGEVIWRAVSDREGHHAQAAKDHLLYLLLGLTTDDTAHIEPRPERMGRYFRVTWGPGPASYHDPEQVKRHGGGAYGEPYPLAETIWAPTSWAAIAIFKHMYADAMAKLWAPVLAEKKRADAKPPNIVAHPWYDPDIQDGVMLPIR